MRFQPETAAGRNVVTRHEPGRVWVGATLYERSVLVPARGDVSPWEPATFDALEPAHFDRIATLPTGQRPEVVIFGSGARLRFVPAAMLKTLIAARIGVETMDTAAACRTYNVLASEGRVVLAALLIEPTTAI